MSVRYALLGLLAQRPCHGYELHSTLLSIVGGQENWDLKPGQIYTTLSRLEKIGLVRQAGLDKESGPEKRVYTITPKGKAEVTRWFREGVAENHAHDEFFIKLMIALSLEEVDAEEIIRIQRNTLYQLLHNVTHQRENTRPDQDRARLLMLDKTVMHLEADLRWLDMIEARLDEVAHQPIPPPANRPRGRPTKASILNS
jgi:DNA-binding PadR family transcriptional regulator